MALRGKLVRSRGREGNREDPRLRLETGDCYPAALTSFMELKAYPAPKESLVPPSENQHEPARFRYVDGAIY